MKLNVGIIGVILFLSTKLSAQQNIEYKLCDQDFRALNMRENLPANAVYTNKNATAEARAKDVVSRLTFDEKLMLTGGWKLMHFPAVERLGLPPVYFSDASQGIHVILNLQMLMQKVLVKSAGLMASVFCWVPE